MIMFRKFWGSWPQHYGRLDSGDVVYIRIRHGEVLIGVGSDEDKAYENSELVKDNVAEYYGVSGAVRIESSVFADISRKSRSLFLNRISPCISVIFSILGIPKASALLMAAVPS